MVLAALTIAFWDFPKPIVAAVNGLAVGGGANIALANYACGYNRPCAHQYVCKSQSCMVQNGRLYPHASYVASSMLQ